MIQTDKIKSRKTSRVKSAHKKKLQRISLKFDSYLCSFTFIPVCTCRTLFPKIRHKTKILIRRPQEIICTPSRKKLAIPQGWNRCLEKQIFRSNPNDTQAYWKPKDFNMNMKRNTMKDWFLYDNNFPRTYLGKSCINIEFTPKVYATTRLYLFLFSRMLWRYETIHFVVQVQIWNSVNHQLTQLPLTNQTYVFISGRWLSASGSEE